MEPPTVSVAVHIAATPARVWDLVTEIALMPTFSDELQSVQWLDDASRSLLDLVVERLAATRVLVMCVGREDDAAAPEPDWLRDDTPGALDEVLHPAGCAREHIRLQGDGKLAVDEDVVAAPPLLPLDRADAQLRGLRTEDWVAVVGSSPALDLDVAQANGFSRRPAASSCRPGPCR